MHWRFIGLSAGAMLDERMDGSFLTFEIGSQFLTKIIS